MEKSNSNHVFFITKTKEINQFKSFIRSVFGREPLSVHKSKVASVLVLCDSFQLGNNFERPSYSKRIRTEPIFLIKILKILGPVLDSG